MQIFNTFILLMICYIYLVNQPSQRLNATKSKEKSIKNEQIKNIFKSEEILDNGS